MLNMASSQNTSFLSIAHFFFGMYFVMTLYCVYCALKPDALLCHFYFMVYSFFLAAYFISKFVGTRILCGTFRVEMRVISVNKRVFVCAFVKFMSSPALSLIEMSSFSIVNDVREKSPKHLESVIISLIRTLTI